MMKCTLDKCRQGLDDCPDPTSCQECDDDYIHRVIGIVLCIVSSVTVLYFLWWLS